MRTRRIASKLEIERFLMGFRALQKTYGIVFYNRKKNTQALLDLEINAAERLVVIESLRPIHYYKGPQPDRVNVGADYWEFGYRVKEVEVYIKLSLGREGQSVRCFSFHPAERTIQYPYQE